MSKQSQIKNLKIFNTCDNPNVLNSTIFSGELTGYPSIDRPWLKYYPMDIIVSDLPKKSIYQYIYDNNIKYSSRVALNYFGNKISYAEMFANIESAAKSLKKMGVNRGDIVSIMSPTLPEAFYLFYAISKIGAVANMIDPRKSPTEIAEYINLVNSKKVFAVSVASEKLIGIKEKTNVDDIVLLQPGDSLPNYLNYALNLKNTLAGLTKKKEPKLTDYKTYKEFIDLGKTYVGKTDCEYQPNEAVVIVYTGGTTGTSKGVVLTNDNINAASFQCENCGFDFQRQHKWLNIMPPFIAYGVGNGLHLPLAIGMEVVLVPQFNPKEFDKLLNKYRPNHMTGVPTHYDGLLMSKLLKNEDLKFIFSAIVGGDKLDIVSEENINKYFDEHNCNYKIAKGYGLTEVCAAVCVTSKDKYNKVGSVGIPFSHTIMAVFDPEDSEQELKYNEIGEICITGPNTMLEYYANESETNKILRKHSDGRIWVHSGDIGYIDEDGCVFILNRMKSMIIRHDGFKIYPVQIENVLMQHYNVSSCAVIGVEDTRFSQGELPKAYVCLKDKSKKDQTIAELKTICNKSLAEYLIPEDIAAIDELPKTLIGKIDFMKLKSENSKVKKIGTKPFNNNSK